MTEKKYGQRHSGRRKNWPIFTLYCLLKKTEQDQWGNTLILNSEEAIDKFQCIHNRHSREGDALQEEDAPLHGGQTTVRFSFDSPSLFLFDANGCIYCSYAHLFMQFSSFSSLLSQLTPKKWENIVLNSVTRATTRARRRTSMEKCSADKWQCMWLVGFIFYLICNYSQCHFLIHEHSIRLQSFFKLSRFSYICNPI